MEGLESIEDFGLVSYSGEEEPIEANVGQPEGLGEEASDDSGMEVQELLKAYGIDGTFMYGEEEVTYDALDSDSKLEVLQHLLADAINQPKGEPVEAQTDLTEYEAEIINYMRANNKTLEDIINDQLQASASVVQPGSRSIAEYNDDEIFQLDYINRLGIDVNTLSQSEAEELESEMTEQLESAKNSKTFSKRMENVRNDMVSRIEERQVYEQMQAAESNKVAKEKFDSDFVNGTYPINSIGPVELEDSDKEFVFSKFLETDAEGNNAFVKEKFSTPEQVFKTVYLAYNAERVIEELVNHYEEKLSKAVNNAKKEVLEGAKFPDKPIKRDGAGSSASKPVDNKQTLQSISDVI
jgi:hypothetical protein